MSALGPLFKSLFHLRYAAKVPIFSASSLRKCEIVSIRCWVIQFWKFIVGLLVVCVLKLSFWDEFDLKLVIVFLLHDPGSKTLVLLVL